jgi:hypothetical protein
MFGKLVDRLLPKLKERREREEALRFVKGVVDQERVARDRQERAIAASTDYALLRPIVPAGSAVAVGWLGGSPRLPDDVGWPQANGKLLYFLCQFNLAALGPGARPKNIALFWDDDGPAVRGLMVEGALKRREGPAHLKSERFSHDYFGDGEGRRDHLPEWPVALERGSGPLPPPLLFRKGNAPGFPDPGANDRPDLADPAWRPFDSATLALLLRTMREKLERRIEHVVAHLGKSLRETTRAELLRAQETLDASLAEFADLARDLAPLTGRFDPVAAAPRLQRLGDLQVFDFRYHRDEDGFAVIESTARRYCDPPAPGIYDAWQIGYEYGLARHAMYAYLEHADALPDPLRARLERKWAFEALHERAILGRPPEGSIDTPHGPDTPNEVLLELPSSSLVGWSWGDGYSLVVLIARDDLKRGDFSRLLFDITN